MSKHTSMTPLGIGPRLFDSQQDNKCVIDVVVLFLIVITFNNADKAQENCAFAFDDTYKY